MLRLPAFLLFAALPSLLAQAPADPAPVKAEPAAKAEPAPEAPKAPTQVTFTRCNVDGPYIAMTFDDGPHGTQTPRLLKMLRDRGIKATFFVVGQCVAEYPEIAKQIVKEGHEIGNHSWSHPSLSTMATDNVRDQLERTHNVIKQETGVAPTVMRPPYGNFTTQQRAWAHATWGYSVVLWDVDTLDWKHRSPAKTEATTLTNTHAGSIILCHDIHSTTVDAMPATLDKLLAKGFKFVTVSELIKLNREAPPKPAAPAKKTATAPLTAKEAATAATSLDELAKTPPKAAPKKK